MSKILSVEHIQNALMAALNRARQERAASDEREEHLPTLIGTQHTELQATTVSPNEGLPIITEEAAKRINETPGVGRAFQRARKFFTDALGSAPSVSKQPLRPSIQILQERIEHPESKMRELPSIETGWVLEALRPSASGAPNKALSSPSETRPSAHAPAQRSESEPNNRQAFIAYRVEPNARFLDLTLSDKLGKTSPTTHILRFDGTPECDAPAYTEFRSLIAGRECWVWGKTLDFCSFLKGTIKHEPFVFTDIKETIKALVLFTNHVFETPDDTSDEDLWRALVGHWGLEHGPQDKLGQKTLTMLQIHDRVFGMAKRKANTKEPRTLLTIPPKEATDD